MNVSGLKRPKGKPREVRTANVLSARRMGFARDLGRTHDSELPHATIACVDAAKLAPAVVFGWANRITAAYFDRAPGRAINTPPSAPDLVVWEKSRAYRGDPRPQDIIDETAGGALTVGAMHARKIVSIPPDEWTGQTKKPPRHWKIWRALSDEERYVIAEAADMSVPAVMGHIDRACEALAKTGRVVGYTHKVHNVLDAAGLFLFVVGRMGKGGKHV